ncbi:hypothetical protein V2J09_001815 [Rumex salicifolius]
MGMGWCTRKLLSRETLRNVSKYVLRDPFFSSLISMGSKNLERNPNPGETQIPYLSYQLKMGFSGSSLISSSQNPNMVLRNLVAGRRYYNSDKGLNFRNFKPKVSRKWWFKYIALFVGSGITIYLWNQETVPYTNRTHLVFMSTKREKLLSEIRFEELNNGLFKGKTLATNHPDTLRLTSISRNLIDALKQSDPETESYDHFKRVGSLIWKRDRAPPETRHIEGLHWEVLVIDLPDPDVFCFPGGKIFFLTGLTKHFENDAEIAALLAHEIGHVVARHLPEQMAKNIWRNILKRMLYYVLMPEVVDKMAILNRKPFSKEMEVEANYIGLVLMALAGYDPSAAISAYEKMKKFTFHSKVNLSFETIHFEQQRAINQVATNSCLLHELPTL